MGPTRKKWDQLAVNYDAIYESVETESEETGAHKAAGIEDDAEEKQKTQSETEGEKEEEKAENGGEMENETRKKKWDQMAINYDAIYDSIAGGDDDYDAEGGEREEEGEISMETQDEEETDRKSKWD